MHILIIGASGQLGTALQRVLQGEAEPPYADEQGQPDVSGAALRHRLGDDLTVTTPAHGELDITDRDSVAAMLSDWYRPSGMRPHVVINCAAFTAVDACETDLAPALAVNTIGADNVARECARVGAKLVHISTDYVFDGRAREPYSDCNSPADSSPAETVSPAPINRYGVTKYAGELLVANASWNSQTCSPPALIIRTSGLFGFRRTGTGGKVRGERPGTNFVEKMIELASRSEPRQIRVVTDQVTCPSFSEDVAWRICELLVYGPEGPNGPEGTSGVVHVANSGPVSWYDFARAVLRISGLDETCVTPVTTAEFGAPARRPAYSVLVSRRCEELGLPPLRHWEQALQAYLWRRQGR